MTILGLDESPDPTVTVFDGYVWESVREKGREILTQFLLKSSICSIKIFN